MNKYDQIFNEKLGELLKDIDFPFGEYSPSFLKEQTAKALMYHTPDTLEISVSEFSSIVSWCSSNGDTAKMPTIHTALLTVKALGAKQFECTLDAYVSKIQGFSGLQSVWDSIAAPLMDEATKYAQSIAKRDARELAVKSNVKGTNGRPLFERAK